MECCRVYNCCFCSLRKGLFMWAILLIIFGVISIAIRSCELAKVKASEPNYHTANEYDDYEDYKLTTSKIHNQQQFVCIWSLTCAICELIAAIILLFGVTLEDFRFVLAYLVVIGITLSAEVIFAIVMSILISPVYLLWVLDTPIIIMSIIFACSYYRELKEDYYDYNY